MARETKVGLLAGLAFIICFAVILANRGAKGPPGLANSFLPDGGLELPKLVQRNQGAISEPAAIANRNRKPQVRAPIQQLPPNQAIANANLSRNPQTALSEPAPPTGAVLPQTNVPEPTRFNHESALAQNTRQTEVPSSQKGNAESPRLDSALRNDPQIPMTATPEPSAPPGRIAPNESPQAITATQQAASPQGTPYTVKASDTLSSIASAHYGAKSRQAVNSIFDANRGVLTDMNNVKPGMVLMIPKRAGAEVEGNQAAAKKQPQAKPALNTEKPAETKPAIGVEKVAETKPKSGEKPSAQKESAEKAPVKKVSDVLADNDKNANDKSAKNFKWYQVKKNDRFASIARDQLGDAGRWQEVYELNKDKFPDPQHIREGVRIKLPGPVVLASAAKDSKEKKR